MSDEEKDLTEEISVAADKGLTDEQITEEVKLKEEQAKGDALDGPAEKTEEVEKSEEVEKPKKKKKGKKQKGTYKGIRVGSNEKVEIEITKESLATYSSYRKGGTVIKLKGVPGKILVELTAEEYEALIEL